MSNQLRSDSNPRRRRRWVNWILAAAGLLLATGLQAQAPPEKEAPDILRQLSDSFEALARRVSPAVVQILVTGLDLWKSRREPIPPCSASSTSPARA